jgi:addiction module RelE/StbE family toxin
MQIRWTQAALNDLKNISYRVERERNLATANRVCRVIYDAVQMLRRHPESGRPGTKEGTRELVIPKSPYVAVYRVTEPDAVHVLRIWQGAQDWR